MINDSMTQWRYCSVPVDPGVAALIAERQEKANHATDDPDYSARRSWWISLALLIGILAIFTIRIVMEVLLLIFRG